MHRLRSSAILSLIIFMIAMSTQATAQATPVYPNSHRVNVTEDHFGVSVADPYRWLEQAPSSSPEIRTWITRQNLVSQGFLSKLSGRDTLERRMRAFFSFGRFSLPKKAGSRYFYTYNDGQKNQAALYVREGLNGAGRLLLDPNLWSKEGEKALAEWFPSPDGQLVAYMVQSAGSDWRTIYILNVDTGKTATDAISNVKFSQLAWKRQSDGFFYASYPNADDSKRGIGRNVQQLRFHTIGTNSSTDLEVLSAPKSPDVNYNGQISTNGRWLVITSSKGLEARSEIQLVDLNKAPIRAHPLIRGFDHDWRFIGEQGAWLYFSTNWLAPRYQVVAIDANHPHNPPVTIVAERPDMLAGGTLIGNRFVLAYLHGTETVAEVVSVDGRKISDVPLPGKGTAAGFGGRSGDSETFFSFSGFTTPPTIYRFDTESLRTTLFVGPNTRYAPEDFDVEETSYPSKDGTLVPITVIRKKSLALARQPAPTILYGYGGFNVSITPSFSPTRLAWLEQGGVYAIAHIRGGGELGQAWHVAGRRTNKQNGFDDFIAAGEWLKANGYTTTKGLAIEGRSNGGLLVGAVVNQRPDLFDAALASAGVMDMLRFNYFTAGPFWTDEYGSPEQAPDFPLLYSYSPYHNIKDGKNYPPILVMTGDSDDRVVPAHSFKYAAALQAASIGSSPHLLRVDIQTGHGTGKPTDKLIEEYADSYAFAAHFTGLNIIADPH